jgi:hypothetical protein
MHTMIEFKWPRPRKCKLDKAGKAISQVGSDRDNQWEPLKEAPTLYLQFARLDGSAEACRDFAASYGLLTTPAQTGAAERVADWQREIKWMKRLTIAAGMVKTANSRRTLLRVTAVVDSRGNKVKLKPSVKPILVLQPKTLLAAMHLQFARAQADGTTLHTCPQCKDSFEVGTEAKTKRSDAKFCSRKCRNRFNYERSVSGRP